ncbi:hypothetical protein MLD38_003137 [Melastoma candidum]|uniref:Uncharacterized protein n=1 Tax=Melastoma candidum TaxID=119954 RepID=A0ACB9S363_9MYRT|nr:hypothetical protein MLD38_003137 [Melastoma candidum]
MRLPGISIGDKSQCHASVRCLPCPKRDVMVPLGNVIAVPSQRGYRYNAPILDTTIINTHELLPHLGNWCWVE